MLPPSAEETTWDDVKAMARKRGVDVSRCRTIEEALRTLEDRGVKVEGMQRERQRVREHLKDLTFKELARIGNDLGLDTTGFSRKGDLLEALVSMEGIEAALPQEEASDPEAPPPRAEEAWTTYIDAAVDFRPLETLLADLRSLRAGGDYNLAVATAREAAAKGEEQTLAYLRGVWAHAVDAAHRILDQAGETSDAAKAVEGLLAKAEAVVKDGTVVGQTSLLGDLHDAVIRLHCLDLETAMRQISEATDFVAQVAGNGADVTQAMERLRHAKERLEANEKADAVRLAKEARATAEKANELRIRELKDAVRSAEKRIENAKAKGHDVSEASTLIARARRLLPKADYKVAAEMITLAGKRLEALQRAKAIPEPPTKEGATKTPPRRAAPPKPPERKAPAARPESDAKKLKTLVTNTWKLIEQAEALGHDVSRPKALIRQAIEMAKMGDYGKALNLGRQAAEVMNRIQATIARRRR
jgi:hypothetical protein